MIYLVSDVIELNTDNITTISTYKFSNWNKTNDILKTLFAKDKYLGVDTETKGFDPYTKDLLSIQIGNYNHQVVIDFLHVGNSVKNNTIEFFKSNKYFIFHNAKFDLKFLMRYDMWLKNVLCTFLAETVLYTGENKGLYPKSLKHVGKKYCNVELNKEVRGKIHYLGLKHPDVTEYAAEDVKYLYDIFKEQYKALEEKELIKTFQLECDFVKVLSYIEMCGIGLNVQQWINKCISDLNKLKNKELELNNFILKNSNEFKDFIDWQLDLFNDNVKVKINWSSSQQVIKLFKTLGLDLKIKDKETGKFKDSVDAKVLKPQLDKHPIISIYLEYKGLEKITSTYGYNWLKHVNPITKRIHSNFTQIIDTGRMSCGGKDKSTGQEYINLLNIPQSNEIRNCIVPNQGNVFINPDYTGQETVILANKSQEPNMIRLINEGGDMHSFVAKAINPKIAHLSDDEIKEQYKKDRQTAKAAGFAVQYGGNGYTIANNLSITEDEGDRVYNAYFKAFPKLDEYFKWVTNQTIKNGYILVDNVIGRKIFVTNLSELYDLRKTINQQFWAQYKKYKEEGFIPSEIKQIVRRKASLESVVKRLSLNYPVQGTGALMIKIAAILVYNEIVKQNKLFKVLIPNLIYDELLVECPEKEQEFWSKFVCDSMEKAAYYFCKNPIIKADPKIINKWEK